MVKRTGSKPPEVGSKILSPEEMIRCNAEATKYTVGKFSLTISPDDSFQYFGKEDRFILFVAETVRWLKLHLNNSNVTLFPELSGRGRLHWHGWIEVPKIRIREFYLFDVLRLQSMGHIELDSCLQETHDVYDCYVRKQRSIFDEVTASNVHFTDGCISITHKRTLEAIMGINISKAGSARKTLPLSGDSKRLGKLRVSKDTPLDISTLGFKEPSF